ncbi:MAG: hypothetical protein ACK4TA_15655 [Saprospiraceae bacterium]
MKNRLYLILLLLLPYCALAQRIPLKNPSFEDTPGHSRIPTGWQVCGFPGESPPDIQPDPALTFEVDYQAYDGNTYLGMVVRDINTWESVTQALPLPMEVDSCYTFSLYAARSKNYISQSKLTEEQANYNTPVIVEIYGGFDLCDFKALLAVTTPVANFTWQKFKFNFKPKEAYTHITIAAYYEAGTTFAYNGNVLIDNIEFIKGCGTGANESMVVNDTVPRVQPTLYTEPKISVNKAQRPAYSGREPKITQAQELPLHSSKSLPLEPINPAEIFEMETLLAALPTTVNSLKDSIIKYGAAIQFQDINPQLEYHYFTFQKKEYYGVNKYLTFIAKAMQQFPNYRLIISVELKGMNRQKRMLSLYDQLIQLGMEENSFLITPFKKSDKDLPWLFHSSSNGLRMQIIPIK